MVIFAHVGPSIIWSSIKKLVNIDVNNFHYLFQLMGVLISMERRFTTNRSLLTFAVLYHSTYWIYCESFQNNPEFIFKTYLSQFETLTN